MADLVGDAEALEADALDVGPEHDDELIAITPENARDTRLGLRQGMQGNFKKFGDLYEIYRQAGEAVVSQPRFGLGGRVLRGPPFHQAPPP